MRYQLLGNSGLRVSELCLGTMTFGEDWGWGSSKEDSRRLYQRFREAGGNFIDTANLYTNGTSERFLGEFIQGEREQVVLATKYTNAAPGQDPNAAGNHRKNMVQALEASLRRLQTGYVDLYWLHVWDSITPIYEVMRAFDDLVRQGKVLYVGASDAPAWWVARANTVAELRGWSPFVGLQIEYSLLERTPERELLPMAAALGLTVTAWSPLASGLLSGKYRVSADGIQSESGGSRLDNPDLQQFLQERARTQRVIETLMAVAQELGRPPAQVALSWLRNRPNPIIPIIGARRLDQLEANLESLNVRLEPEQLRRLDEASRIELGFPHDFFTKPMVRNFTHGGLADAIDGLGARLSA
ncbi:MAG: aldo/keto reductase [Verrucomicrobia bacterium]|nr:aldo/keto reductase [Verrucomicrobiota bacterium]